MESEKPNRKKTEITVLVIIIAVLISFPTITCIVNIILSSQEKKMLTEAGYDMDVYKRIRDTELQPYLDKMGNCELRILPGIHCIYDQRPDDVADIIREFLDRIGG